MYILEWKLLEWIFGVNSDGHVPHLNNWLGLLAVQLKLVASTKPGRKPWWFKHWSSYHLCSYHLCEISVLGFSIDHADNIGWDLGAWIGLTSNGSDYLSFSILRKILKNYHGSIYSDFVNKQTKENIISIA